MAELKVFCPQDLITQEVAANSTFPYEMSFEIGKDHIDDFHRALYHFPVDRKGKVAFPFPQIDAQFWADNPRQEARYRVDMMKMYEIAYFTKGDVIELGTARGRSTYVISKAIKASGRSAKLFTVELNSEYQADAIETLSRQDTFDIIDFRLMSGHVFLKRAIESGITSDFVFVDHCHDYIETALTCVLLDHVVSVGGFVLFHDYCDRRNFSLKYEDYDVVRGIRDGLDLKRFQKVGIFGSTGLFYRVS